MPEPRKNEAKWQEAQHRWYIAVQRDGDRVFFYSPTKGTKGKIEAEKKADTWLRKNARSGNERIGQLWEEWLSHQERLYGTEAASCKQHRKNGEHYILPHLKNKKASSITLRDWQGVIDDAYIKRNLAKKTLQNIRGSLTAFWKYCHSGGVDLVRPEALEIPRNAKVGERTILQPADLKALFSIDTITHYKKQEPCWYIHAWRFQVLTGFRPGEVIGLQWSDIKGDTITIRRAINVDGIETSGKNKNARRTIVLPDMAQSELAEQKAMLKSLGILSPWVFPAKDGSASSEKNIYKAWLTYKKQHGISAASLYELRHTMVSVSADVPDAMLKQVVGHSKSMDTRGVYGHRVDGQAQDTAERINAAFESAIKKG